MYAAGAISKTQLILKARIAFRNTLITKRHHKVTKALVNLPDNMGCTVSDGEFVLLSGKRTFASPPTHTLCTLTHPCNLYVRTNAAPGLALARRPTPRRGQTEEVAEVTAIGDTFSPFVWESYGTLAPQLRS
jgi:hypothetical protein